jgi:chemotaxis protein MotB
MSDKGDIIILKRVEAEEEKRKGGVWKIAHADFMTAMMAFFLIMWLVNATDEEMKKSIANYFNPINLMASPTDRRGLVEPDVEARPPATATEAGQTAGTRPLGADAPGDDGASAGGGNVEEGNENRMDSAGINEETDGPEFHDPYAVMASSAADLAPDEPVAVDVPQSAHGEPGHTSLSETIRDPFDPAYWQTVSPRQSRTIRPGPADTADQLPPDAVIDAGDRRPTEPAAEADPGINAGEADDAAGVPAAVSQAEPHADPLASVGPRSAAAEAVLAALSEPEAPADTAADPEPARERPIEAAAREVREALAGVAANVEVSVEDRGGEETLLISLTDERSFSMFAIGSAEPTPETVELFGRVAGVLGELDGEIVIRGHTDARPFRGNTSDNWMLSFQRAHAAKEALIGSGVPETRITRVEGLADREPKHADDPLADENRRIEILYEPSGETP